MAMRRINVDWPLVLIALALSLFGIATVYSAGQTDAPTYVNHAWRAQIVWFILSLSAAYAISRSSVRLIEWLTVPLYWFSIVLLLIVLIPGFGSGAGTAASVKGWLTIGGHRLGQPAEFAKLAVVLMLALVLSKNREAPKSMLDLWRPGLVVGIPWVLIMKQPDLGTGIVFVGIFFGMLFWAGVEWRLLVLIASPVVSLILAFSTSVWASWFCLFVALFLRVVRISERANDSFSSLIAFGLLSSWLVHVLENIGMTINLMPITGIPLPFFSYGGSFMLASWLAIGILVRISSEGRGRSGQVDM